MWVVGALARRRVQRIRLTVNQASGNLPGLGRIVRKETIKTNLNSISLLAYSQGMQL